MTPKGTIQLVASVKIRRFFAKPLGHSLEPVISPFAVENDSVLTN